MPCAPRETAIYYIIICFVFPHRKRGRLFFCIARHRLFVCLLGASVFIPYLIGNEEQKEEQPNDFMI